LFCREGQTLEGGGGGEEPLVPAHIVRNEQGGKETTGRDKKEKIQDNPRLHGLGTKKKIGRKVKHATKTKKQRHSRRKKWSEKG